MTLDDILAQLTPAGVEHLREAIACGKWADGRLLDIEQKALCLQALIAWEEKNLPPAQRTGYLPKKERPAIREAANEPQILKGLE